MANTRDLESQAETDRSEIAATLDELRSRMSTGQIVDQALAYARCERLSEPRVKMAEGVVAPMPGRLEGCL